ncbi:hypothetical protein O9993_07530 [Vibrio lentus]|nr:hypothetical protein [Vibrio lentus]
MPKVSGIGGDVPLSNAMGTLFNLCDKVAKASRQLHIFRSILLAAIEDKGT